MTDEWTRFDRGPDRDRSVGEVEAGLQMPVERVMLTQRAVRKVLVLGRAFGNAMATTGTFPYPSTGRARDRKLG